MRINRHITVLLSTLLLLVGQAVAQPGSSGLSFLKLGIGARSIAMGNVGVALAKDPSALYYNPSTLQNLSAPQLLVMHREWIQDASSEHLAASFPIGDISFGTYLSTMSISEIEIRTVPGPPQGTFSARNAALGIGGAYGFDSTISIGLGLKYLYEKILVDEANGWGLDIGATYLTPWNVRTGISITNIGSMGKFKNEASRLPTTLRAGVAYEYPLADMDLMMTSLGEFVSVLPERSVHLHVGLELNYNQLFAARIGYLTGYDSKNISQGVGLYYGIIRIDYAFVPFKFNLGTTHTFSVGLVF